MALPFGQRPCKKKLNSLISLFSATTRKPSCHVKIKAKKGRWRVRRWRRNVEEVYDGYVDEGESE